MDLDYKVELGLWARELKQMGKDQAAKKHLNRLKNISLNDGPRAQIWISQISQATRHNDKLREAANRIGKRMSELGFGPNTLNEVPVIEEQNLDIEETVEKVEKAVEGEPKRGRGRPKLSAEEVASREAVKAQEKADKEAEKEKEKVARREEFLNKIQQSGNPRFADFGALTSYYEGVKSKRTDTIAKSGCVEVVRDGNGLNLQVHKDSDPDTSQTIEPGSYPILEVGEVTFCKRLGMSYNYFKKYPESDEIVEHINTLNRNADKDWYVREVSGEIQGVLPKAFTPIDNYEIFHVLKEYSPTLANFVEGEFDKPADLIDLTFPEFKYGEYTAALRIINSEVDSVPLTFALGLTDGEHYYISFSPSRGSVKLPHRKKSGFIADNLKLKDLAGGLNPLITALEEAKTASIDKDRTTEFLVDRLGVLGKDAGEFVTDYFIANPQDDTILAYVNGLLCAAKAFSPAKMQKVSDIAVKVLFKDIPVLN